MAIIFQSIAYATVLFNLPPV